MSENKQERDAAADLAVCEADMPPAPWVCAADLPRVPDSHPAWHLEGVIAQLGGTGNHWGVVFHANRNFDWAQAVERFCASAREALPYWIKQAQAAELKATRLEAKHAVVFEAQERVARAACEFETKWAALLCGHEIATERITKLEAENAALREAIRNQAFSSMPDPERDFDETPVCILCGESAPTIEDIHHKPECAVAIMEGLKGADHAE